MTEVNTTAANHNYVTPTMVPFDRENMLEVTLENDSDFLKVTETLTRMGIAARDENTLFQSCHLLHKRGRYYIVHFLEMFALDGRRTEISSKDIARRNLIAGLLEEWGLVKIVNHEAAADRLPVRMIKIISYRDRDQWNLKSKYSIGHSKTAA